MKKLLLIIIVFSFQFTFSQSDCISAIPVCGNSGLAYTPTGHGNIDEELGGCMASDENLTVWYTFTIGTSGTLEFTINPNVFADDYDFAVYPANIPCSQVGTPTGQPIRCNYSGADGPTGIGTVAPGASAGAYDTALPVTAGQQYYLVVDNWSGSPNGFTLSWGGTANLTSPFNSSIQPFPFIEPGINQDGIIQICADPTLFDFSTLSSGIINGNPNFNINYYLTPNDALTGNNAITTPINVNSSTTYHYAINYTDPNNPNNPINTCKEFGTIEFDPQGLVALDDTILACNNKEVGSGTFDLTTAVLYTGTGFTVQYYPTMVDLNNGTNEITNPTNYNSVSTTVYGLVTNAQNCTAVGEISLQFYPQLDLNETGILGCNNNNSGIGIFNLTTAPIYSNPNWTAQYYPSLMDAQNDTNVIVDPTNYQSAEGTAYAVVTNEIGCESIVAIHLEYYPQIAVFEDELLACYIVGNPSTGMFDLSQTTVTLEAPVVETYYNSFNDAVNNNNPISNFNNYISPNADVYVRVTNNQGCWNISKVKLTVVPPNYSETLTDQYICIEDRVTLDAGPGYQKYEWSTGEFSREITVGIGVYTVILTSGYCTTTQTVRVMKSPEPVVNKVDIVNNTVTLHVTGGNPPYLYSIDGNNWQNSNTFENVPRGENRFFVKDTFDCQPIEIAVTVPNFVNAITPNGDGINDYFDYSALSHKKDLAITIYNRYGNKIFIADKNTAYRWNGTINGGKKATTGTYWYTATWKDPNTGQEFKYDGWIMVKNRD